MGVRRRQSREPIPPPPKADIGDITATDLATYNGRNIYAAYILVAVKGQVYDVSKDRLMYGFNKPYNVYAGNEISRCVCGN